jgi:transposase-like protein
MIMHWSILKIRIDNIANQIKDQLYEKNLLKDKNDLIPYKTMNRNFLINKIKVLNHKWLIANFSDGTHWGELLITFKIDQSGKINFELKEHFLYTTPE